MKKKTSIILAVLGVLTLAYGISKHAEYNSNPNTKERNYLCEVIGKEKNQRRNSTEFLLVVKSEGKTFTVNTNPATYSTSAVGDKLTLKLNGRDFGIFNKVTPLAVVFALLLFFACWFYR